MTRGQLGQRLAAIGALLIGGWICLAIVAIRD